MMLLAAGARPAGGAGLSKELAAGLMVVPAVWISSRTMWVAASWLSRCWSVVVGLGTMAKRS
jgi:hypothetical protein